MLGSETLLLAPTLAKLPRFSRLQWYQQRLGRGAWLDKAEGVRARVQGEAAHGSVARRDDELRRSGVHDLSREVGGQGP